jgi:hypothetical protein
MLGEEKETSIDSLVNGEDDRVPYAEYLRVVNNIIKMTGIRDYTRHVYLAIDLKTDELIEARGIEVRPRKRAGQFGETDVKVPRVVYDSALLLEDEVRSEDMTTIKQAGDILDVVADEIVKASPRGRPADSEAKKTEKEIAKQKIEEKKSEQQKAREEHACRDEYSVPKGQVGYFAFDALAQRLLTERFSMSERSIEDDNFREVYSAVRGFIECKKGDETVSLSEYKTLVNLVMVHDEMPKIDGRIRMNPRTRKSEMDLSAYKDLVNMVLTNDEAIQQCNQTGTPAEGLAPHHQNMMATYRPEGEYALGQLVRIGSTACVVTEKIFKHKIRIVTKNGMKDVLVECNTAY